VSELKRMTEDQRTLLGCNFQVPYDVRELYLVWPTDAPAMNPMRGLVEKARV
jgi:hypothetical protein